MPQTLKKILSSSRVIPVVVIDHIEDAVPLANALINGGLKVLEITLRTSCALLAIKEIKKTFPESIVASGTVIDPRTLQASLEAGVDFVVTPGMTSELMAAAKSNNAQILPGAITPSEVMELLENDFNLLKFFPAEAAGGIDMLKSLSGPLPQAIFCPTGGINLKNAADYLSLNNVACVGGTWMLDKALIENKQWSSIEKLASEASQL